MKLTNYPDGTSYAKVEVNDTVFTFRVNNYNDL